ncbi:hypothetical protein, partial [Salmonella sp. SAL4432]|uniref:hypothetical protein n=1 Tax=Salmonella sp. SAL4432 TaxID=3159887 RepID=UPI0039796EC6
SMIPSPDVLAVPIGLNQYIKVFPMEPAGQVMVNKKFFCSGVTPPRETDISVLFLIRPSVICELDGDMSHEVA